MRRLLAIPLAVALLLAAPSAFAGRLDATVVIDDPNPVHGQVVTFTVTQDPVLTVIYLECRQDGIAVLVGYSPYSNDTTYQWSVALRSGAYTAGPASCAAEVQRIDRHRPWRVLAEVAFEVAA